MSPLSNGKTGLGCSPFGPISLAWLETRTINTVVDHIYTCLTCPVMMPTATQMEKLDPLQLACQIEIKSKTRGPAAIFFAI